MTGFSRSANGQGHVAGDRLNGHVLFSCLEVVVAAEDVTSVAEKEMNGRSDWVRDVARAADSLHVDVWSGGYVGVAVCVLYGAAVGVAIVSSVMVQTPPPSVAWRLA